MATPTPCVKIPLLCNVTNTIQLCIVIDFTIQVIFFTIPQVLPLDDLLGFCAPYVTIYILCAGIYDFAIISIISIDKVTNKVYTHSRRLWR